MLQLIVGGVGRRRVGSGQLAGIALCVVCAVSVPGERQPSKRVARVDSSRYSHRLGNTRCPIVRNPSLLRFLLSDVGVSC